MEDAPSTNAEAMKRYVEALERKDLEAATAFRADDVLLHFPGRNPFSGDFVGREAFLEHYGRLSTELGGTIELAEVREVLLGAEHVVALVRERAVRGERTLEFDRVNVYNLGGGKIVETLLAPNRHTAVLGLGVPQHAIHRLPRRGVFGSWARSRISAY